MYEAAMTLSELSEKSLSFKKPDINLCMDDFYQVDFLMDKLDIEKPVAEYLIYISTCTDDEFTFQAVINKKSVFCQAIVDIA